MFTITNKLRTIIIALVASASLALAAIVPAASQAAPPTMPSWLYKAPMGAATCGGSPVGTTTTTTITYSINGQIVGTATIENVCGPDGQWQHSGQ